MRITSYHSQQPDWRESALSGKWIGLELEVHHNSGSDVVAQAMDQVEYGQWPAPILELDGSLDNRNGVEIVCPPLPVEEVLADNGYITRMMERLRAAGTEETRSGYGMHVNFNVSDWSYRQRQVVAYLLGWMTPEVARVAGRVATRATAGVPSMRLGAFGGNGSRTVYTSPTKYQPARMRQVDPSSPTWVLEFRAPASTLDPSNLRRCVEFVYDVAERVESRVDLWLAACFAHSVMTQASSYSRVLVERMLTPVLPPLNATSEELQQFINSITVSDTIRMSSRNDFVIGDIVYASVRLPEQAIRICTLIAEGGELSSSAPWTGIEHADTLVLDRELGQQLASSARPRAQQPRRSSPSREQVHVHFDSVLSGAPGPIGG
jgi:hypothetical protein